MNVEGKIADVFARSRPNEAARVLETLPEDAVREFLEETELTAAAVVVESLTSLMASRCLSLASSSRAAAIANELPLERASDLLRRADAETRSKVLSEMPPNRRGPLQKLLRFPEHTAGAMMEPRVESFLGNMTVGETLRKVHETKSELRYYLYVVDEQLVLRGVASWRQLVAAEPDLTLRAIMTRSVQTLSARAGKSAILSHPAWRRYPVLPVVDENGHLLGVFRYVTFRRLQERSDSEEPSPVNVALALGELFWLSAAGLLRGLEQPSVEVEEER